MKLEILPGDEQGKYVITVDNETEYSTTHPVRTILNILAENGIKGIKGRKKGYRMPRETVPYDAGVN